MYSVIMLQAVWEGIILTQFVRLGRCYLDSIHQTYPILTRHLYPPGRVPCRHDELGILITSQRGSFLAKDPRIVHTTCPSIPILTSIAIPTLPNYSRGPSQARQTCPRVKPSSITAYHVPHVNQPFIHSPKDSHPRKKYLKNQNNTMNIYLRTENR